MYQCQNNYRTLNDLTQREARNTHYNQRLPLETMDVYPGTSYWRNIYNQAPCRNETVRVVYKNNFADTKINSRKGSIIVPYVYNYSKGKCIEVDGGEVSLGQCDNVFCMQDEDYERNRIGRYTNINDRKRTGHFNPNNPYNLYFSLDRRDAFQRRYNY